MLLFVKLDIRSVERGICPIAALYLLRFTLVSYDFFQLMLVSNSNISLKIFYICVTWHRRSNAIYVLQGVNYNHTLILHRYWDLKTGWFGGYDLDLLGLRDVIGHVTIGLAICGFLYVINYNRTSILHGYKYIKHQRFWGHDFDLLGSRDVIGHVTTVLAICSFP